jgi:hypothetical protein
MLVKFYNLSPLAKRQVADRYVNWIHAKAHYGNFTNWANNHAFYIRKDGKLDERRRHCEPVFMADK